MWDSPYQALRFSTASTGLPAAAAVFGFVAIGAAIFTSAMTCPQIGFLDALVLGQIGVIAFRKHVTPRQHRNDIGKVCHDAQILLNHQDRVIRGYALDQSRDLVDVLIAPTLHRLLP